MINSSKELQVIVMIFCDVNKINKVLYKSEVIEFNY
jgi:hypothetical protein